MYLTLLKHFKDLDASDEPMLEGLDQWAPVIASRLLERGVIAPPCKCGDDVWLHDVKVPCHSCFDQQDQCHKNCPHLDSQNLVVKSGQATRIEYSENQLRIHVTVHETEEHHKYERTYWACDFGKHIYLSSLDASMGLKAKERCENK